MVGKKNMETELFVAIYKELLNRGLLTEAEYQKLILNLQTEEK